MQDKTPRLGNQNKSNCDNNYLRILIFLNAMFSLSSNGNCM